MKPTPLLAVLLASLLPAAAAIKSGPVEYQHGSLTLEGWQAHDEAKAGRRPAVLVVHQWLGLTDYEKKRAEMLAQLGYNVLCVDIYGKGIRPPSPKEGSAESGKYKANRALLRERVNAGLAVLKQHPLTDPQRVAAIGYCFGGTTALELARSGADIAGVVSFHGALDSPAPADGRNIKCRILALHGADDPFVPAKDVDAFCAELRAAKVDWQLVSYGGAVHSFTHWHAGTDNSKGAAYNAKADQRSWEAMKDFFAELFGK
jgi:dienelactone hydrolase